MSGVRVPVPAAPIPAVAAVLLALSWASTLWLGHSRDVTASLHRPGPYVALGDSYVSGPGIPSQTGTPPGCQRSTQDYPSLIQDVEHAAGWRDVSCGGATTADLTGPQPTRAGTNPAQLSALSTDTSLVTLGIGANDIGFGDIVQRCLSGSGTACREHYLGEGHDVLADRIAATAPKLASILGQIARRAPLATVLVVGYPTLLPVSGPGCPQAPATPADLAYLNQTFQALNTMLRTQASAAGDHYIDVATTSRGHDMCAPAGTAWIEGRHPTPATAIAFHPNVLDMRNVASQVLSSDPPGSDISQQH